jgi:outer membrane protein assembly factor BamB
LFFLYFAFLIFQVFSQQSVAQSNQKKSVDLSVPLSLCYQKKEEKNPPVNFASDKISSYFSAYQNGKITKVDLLKDEVSWTSELGGEIRSNITYENGRVYLITAIAPNDTEKENADTKKKTNYILWSLNADTGLTVWQFSFNSEYSVYLQSNKDSIFLLTKDGFVKSISRDGAHKNWENHLPGHIAVTPFIFDNKIYVGIEDNSILLISVGSGEIISKISTPVSSLSFVGAFEDKLILGDKKGYVNLFDPETNKSFWSVRFGGEISGLTRLQNGILVSSFDNFVYLISAQKGKTIWKKRLSGRASSVPLVVDNLAVFITAADNSAAVIDLRNGKIINQISLFEIGFILSKPVILGNLLVFSTNNGVFAFAATNTPCFIK